MLKTITKTLRDIVADHGMVDNAQLAVLAVEYPLITVGAKMGCSPRFTTIALNMKEQIDYRLAECDGEYVRELFLPCSTYDYIKGVIDRENVLIDCNNSFAKNLIATTPNFENTPESFLIRD